MASVGVTYQLGSCLTQTLSMDFDLNFQVSNKRQHLIACSARCESLERESGTKSDTRQDGIVSHQQIEQDLSAITKHLGPVPPIPTRGSSVEHMPRRSR